MQRFSLRISTKFRQRSCPSRWFSAGQTPRVKTIEVPVGGSGSLQLEIQSPSHNLSAAPNTLIYLPPGPPKPTDTTNGTSTSTRTSTILSSLLPNTTIITLNYRLLPPTHIFPVPIHDTSTAFNLILHNFTNQASPSISLLGSRIGGTLATTLALTSPNSIHSVAVTEPIVDWVSLDGGLDSESDSDTPTFKKPKPNQHTSLDAKPLLTLRSHLFPKPDSYFDPFASPTLFLRAPGRDCPQPYPDPLATLTPDNAIGWPPSPSSEDTTPNLRPIKRRKVLRRWPSNAAPESVRLPRFRVFVRDDQAGEGMVLRQQGEELVELMRKVCFYGWEREEGEGWVGVEVLSREEDEEEGMWGWEEAAGWLARSWEGGG